MKVIDFLTMVPDYQRVSICPVVELEWNDENPYTLNGDKVRDLKWVFVQAVGQRTVEKITTVIDENENQYNKSVLKICYR